MELKYSLALKFVTSQNCQKREYVKNGCIDYIKKKWANYTNTVWQPRDMNKIFLKNDNASQIPNIINTHSLDVLTPFLV